jgi:hypothetical protein
MQANEYVKVEGRLNPLAVQSQEVRIGKMKYKFRQKRLRQEVLRDRIRRNTEYRRILSNPTKNMTSAIQEQMVQNTYTDQHELWSWSGLTGTGKSRAVIWLAEGFFNYQGKNFDVNKFISWSGTELLMQMNKYGDPDVFFIKDEMPDIMVGIGSMSEWQALKRVSATIRKKKISIATIDPAGRTFISSVNYYFETWDYDWDIYDIRGNIIEARPNVTRCIVYDEFHIPFGYIITGLPSSKVINAYEQKKSNFLDRQTKGGFDDLTEKHLAYAYVFSKMPKYVDLCSEERKGTKSKRIAYIWSMLPALGFGPASKTQVELIETQSMMFVLSELPDVVVKNVEKTVEKWIGQSVV